MFEVLAAIPSGLSVTFGGLGVVYLFAGTVLGFIFGVLPGLGGIAALALLIPFSWGMLPHHAMLMFAGAMGAVPFGGSISAILLNVPGTPQNIATAFDGFPLAQKGKAGVAIGTAAAASALGAVIGIFVLVLLIPVLRAIILSFGPPEFVLLIMFGLVAIPLFTGRNFITGLIGGALGLTLSFVGFDGTTGVLRYNFGTFYLYDGIQLIPVIMGLFAVAQAIDLISSGGAVAKGVVTRHKFRDVLEGVKMVFRYKGTFYRSSLLGTIIGIIPGMGGVISNLFSWIIAAQSSARGKYFGTGEIEGVIASEAANNAKDGGALLPTLAFGIPGSGEMAVLMGAFILHGLAPGPQFLRDNLTIAWAIIFGLLSANIIVALFGVGLAHHMAKLTSVKGNIIAPIIICASLIGALVMRNEPVDMFVALIFGFTGFLMEKYDFSRITLVLGFILGHLAEMSFSQSLMISDNDPLIFFRRPIALFLLILLVVLVIFIQLILPLIKRKSGRSKTQETIAPEKKKESQRSLSIKPGFWKNLGFYFSFLLFFWFVMIIIESFSYPLKAKIFPLSIAIVSLPLIIATLLGYMFEEIANKLESLKGSHLFDISSADGLKGKVLTSKKSEITASTLLNIASWFFGAAGLFYLLGFFPAMIIFLFSFLRFYSKHRLKICIGVTAAASLAAWVIFVSFLNILPVSLFFL